jgi:hypothetical protein
MAKTPINVVQLEAYGGFSQSFTYTAADLSNQMEVRHPGGDGVFLLIQNADSASHSIQVLGASNARTYLKTSANYTEIATAAGEYSIAPLPLAGYDQGGGVVHVDILVSDTDLNLVVFKMSATP